MKNNYPGNLSKGISIITGMLSILLFSTQYAVAQSITYGAPYGSVQTYTVPTGCTIISATLIGGCGGNSAILTGSNTSGSGGLVACTYSVTPGEVLYIYTGAAAGAPPAAGLGACNGGTGGDSASTGGYPGGGGGGSSAIRSGSGISETLLEAGGGGGGAGGGAAFRENGGAGNATSGGAGGGGDVASGGGTQTTGGTAGTGIPSGAGTVGSQTAGGNGENGVSTTDPDAGGGGGGGWWGGGGGGAGGTAPGGAGLNAGSGGGGSNFVGGAGVITIITNGTNTSCGDGSVTICAYPYAGTITGTDTVCVGSTMSLSDATANGTSGTWSSSSANVTVGSGTGIVTGVASGTAIITYSSTNACGTTITTNVVTVLAIPSPINGNLGICGTGATTSLSDASGTGTWSSTTTGVATIGSSSGTVTSVSLGTTTISYIATYVGTYGCAATAIVTVNPLPGGISGTLSVCTGLTTSLSDTPTGGAWSTSSSNATVGTVTGIVTGVNAGTAIITYTLSTGCLAEAIVTVNPNPNPITGVLYACAGLTTSLSSTTSGGAWSSSNGTVATIGTGGGTVTTLTAGTTTISYILSTGCLTTVIVTVNEQPTAINGTLAVCAGSTTSLTDGTSGGTWSSSNGNATIGTGGGVVTGVTTGTSIISYVLSTGCLVSAVVTVNSMGAISPANPTICLGSTLTLSDASGGGVWSSSNTSVATIGTSGLVTSLGIGTTTISYSTSGCTSTTVVTVSSGPGGITPTTASVCTGSTVNLTDGTPGGVWSSNSPANATVGTSGVVFGVAAGTAMISYSIGTCSASAMITVNTTPGTISPASVTICTGGTATLTDAPSGGAWSSSNTSVATISSGGLVTTTGIGTSTISYILSGCIATATITVNNAPSTLSPTTATICSGSTTTLSDAVTGGAWSSSNGSVATVSGGVVTGISTGTVTITYAIGTCYTTATVTVNTGVAAISPSSASLCVGNTVTLADGTPGGAWSSSSANATVAGGFVTAIAAGSATISYVLGSCYSTALITIATSPSTISPATSNVCVGSTVSLSDGVSGGIWSSSSAAATVGITGIVTGVATGTTTISYSIGTCFATAVVTVSPAVNAGTINAPASTICPASSITLTDAIAGGTWSASNGNATIGTSGLLTGVTTGTDVISYTVTSSCGSAVATTIITISATAGSGTILGPATICQGSYDIYIDYTTGGTWSVTNGNAVISPVGVVTALTTGTETIVYTAPGSCTTATLTITITPAITSAGTITGPASACIGSSITLSDATEPGGTWIGTNTTATVGSSTGIITGETAGVDTVIYTIVTTCGTYSTSATVNVDATSTPATITGPSSVCIGSSILLNDADGGGSWSSSNANATVIPGFGLVTGVAPGLDTITYTVTNGCGLGSITKTITVISTPSAGTITGPSNVCPGATINLTDAVADGTWSAANGNATVSSTGLVTGVTSGTDEILYTVTAACGTVSAFMTVTINPAPDASIILGPDSVCTGSNITLLDFATDGSWSITNSNATLSGVGSPSMTVTGVTVGLDTVYYTATNSCGTAIAMKIVTIIDIPNPGVITGISNVCVGSAITLIDTVPGGIWLSSNGNAQLVGPGIVSGITSGIDSIFYVVINACGTNEARKIVNVDPIPVIPAISGPTSQCAGTMINYTDGLSGGIWTSSNSSIASINSFTGSTVGLAQGIDTISYTVTNVFGCPATVSTVDTVNVIPVVSNIMGGTSVCVTSTITLSDTTAGGVWSSSDNTIATVDATGDVTGAGAGVVMISYTVTGACGITSSTQAVTVNPLPVLSAISGTTNECVGATVTLSNTTAGGVWSSSDNTIASVDGSGDVTGIAAGTVTIIYQVTNTFGCSSAVSVTETVNALPVVAAITGVTNECTGSVSTLNDATGGGVWSSSDNTIASVDATGDVTGVAGGIVTIFYTVTNSSGCTAMASTPDTVNVFPIASAIAGTMSVCAGSTTPLFDAVTGGAWSSTDNTIATVDPVAGIVTGVTAGMDTVIYTVTNGCGSVMDSAAITVNPLPVITPIISTTSTTCTGSMISLTEATTGGIWSSSDTTVATVSSTGSVTGISTGTATITYMVTNGFSCSDYAIYTITIVTAVTGVDVVPTAATLCHGNPVNMHISSTIPGLTYQWLCNGNVISGATNSGYITDSAGIYTLEVNNGACTETFAGTVVSNPPHPVISFISPDILYTGSFYAYQWYKNGVAIAGANSATLIESGNGDYTVVVTDINGCSDTSAVYTISGGGGGGTTGVNNVTVSNIKIYPNPATSTLTVEAPVKVNITLLGIDGRMLMHQDDAHNIDVSELPNGMYLIMIYDENNTLLSTSKFVKAEK